MNVYAVAAQMEQRECGPYSRPTHSFMRAFIVHAENDVEARNAAYTQLRAQYPALYFAGVAVELVSLYGVSTEGAAWASEAAQK